MFITSFGEQNITYKCCSNFLIHLFPTWTLKRRLSSYNTSFSVLLEKTQKELSPPYLLDANLSISEVAYKLGYSDISSFSKAFQRWYGISPKQWISQQP
ncbi:helix-turn-helix transcriptional regulator [Acinetobacter baumannii]|uniref:helix-turn-helix transcriptional regulator n=1 Tax=Acinetobacter baumannii TaxID=470 RepID=UPI00160072D1